MGYNALFARTNMLHSIRIGRLDIFPNLFLAPMAGIADRPFRAMVKGFGGCGLTYSELVSVEGMVRRQKRTLEMMAPDPAERPYAIQLYGARPEAMAAAAAIAVEAGADLVDINAGCPAQKVTRSRGGSYLLKDSALLEQILRAVRRAVDVPVTLKIRSGYTLETINFLEIGRLAEDCGIDALTLHPRTRTQMFTGRSDWNHIRQLKQAVRIPVIGNGDVSTPEDTPAMFDATGCDAVMIGRGVSRNPWLIRQSFDLLERGAYAPVHPRLLLELLARTAVEVAGRTVPKALAGELKKICSWWIHGIPGAAAHRQHIYHLKDPAEIVAYIQELARSQAGGDDESVNG
jgi:tRNA-dihydrouridine synthase B